MEARTWQKFIALQSQELYQAHISGLEVFEKRLSLLVQECANRYINIKVSCPDDNSVQVALETTLIEYPPSHLVYRNGYGELEARAGRIIYCLPFIVSFVFEKEANSE